jgi:hypothetical protein
VLAREQLSEGVAAERTRQPLAEDVDKADPIRDRVRWDGKVLGHDRSDSLALLDL